MDLSWVRQEPAPSSVCTGPGSRWLEPASLRAHECPGTRGCKERRGEIWLRSLTFHQETLVLARSKPLWYHFFMLNTFTQRKLWFSVVFLPRPNRLIFVIAFVFSISQCAFSNSPYWRRLDFPWWRLRIVRLRSNSSSRPQVFVRWYKTETRDEEEFVFCSVLKKIHCSSTGNISTLMLFTWSLFVQISMGIWWTHHRMIGTTGLCLLFLNHFNGFSETSWALAFWEITKNLLSNRS